ncbi:hypothetical protein F5Y16DRAFT_421937, partial [Xylariaceae sp. FL0255]
NCVVFVEKYVDKVKRGLEKLEKRPPNAQDQCQFANLGTRLQQHRDGAKQAGTHEVEKLLNTLLKEAGSLGWLADIYSRYMSLQRREVSPTQSETGDAYQERNVKNRERFCQLTSAVVDRLEPHWGVFASLIFNALEVTNFKGSDVYRRISVDDLDRTANAIVHQLLSAAIRLEIFKDTQVINPAFFLAIFSDRPYQDICKDIGLQRFDSLCLQEQIDALADSLDKMGLRCGQIRLSVLVELSGIAVEWKNDNLVLCLGPSHSTSDEQELNSRSEGTMSWTEFMSSDIGDVDDWMNLNLS